MPRTLSVELTRRCASRRNNSRESSANKIRRLTRLKSRPESSTNKAELLETSKASRDSAVT